MNLEELKNKINSISDQLIKIEETAPTRVYLSCEAEKVYNICKFLFEDVKARFVISTAIDADNCYEVIHHFAYDQLSTFINVKAFIRDRNKPLIESITPIIPGAEWIEREMHDTFGIEFNNHPNMKRLILADDWPQGICPLKKDYEFKKLR
ncbi:MAG: NADH-quinone oxidoreductase subunit C [Sedimentisphaerales bacterium]|nr:NADH-quinone oxidoreductase subunit C [Sedimentisphaerales bacterium]